MVKLVAVCTRVAWFSHKSGGFLAHDLPEVLVNADDCSFRSFQNLRMLLIMRSLWKFDASSVFQG
jgi:hypothetical protein